MPPRLVAERFQLQELLGEGEMSSVYRAVDSQTGSSVALKIMRDPAYVPLIKTFQKELQTRGHLKHQNIVDVQDLTEIKEDSVRRVSLVMPLLAGATLAKLIKESSPRLTISFVLSIISQVCHGLEAAHNQALIHGNVKPSNIFIGDDNSVKLTDFGLVSGAGSSVAPLETGLPYVSPEQINEGRTTPESDIYSLGVVAYESLTGICPFKRLTVEGTREAVLHYDPAAILELNPIVNQSVSDTIRKAMAKQPTERYSSARVFGEMLEKGSRKEPKDRVGTDRGRSRLELARKKFEDGDDTFASEILNKLEAEGYTDHEVARLRSQIADSEKQKRTTQLLDEAKRRLEENETELALAKLRQVLEMEPANGEACSLTERVERQRSEDQISDLLRIARQHLEAKAFAKARETAQQVLAVRQDNGTASELLTEIAVQEQVAARERADQLYASALSLYDRGEISEACSELERALAIRSRVPGAMLSQWEADYDRSQAAGSEPKSELLLRILEKARQRYPGHVEPQQHSRLGREQRDRKHETAVESPLPSPGVGEANRFERGNSHLRLTTSEEPQNEKGVEPPPRKASERDLSALPPGEWIKFLLIGASVAVFLLAAGLGLSRLFSHQKPTPTAPPVVTRKSVAVPLTISPSSAKVTVNGEVRTGSTLTLDPDKTYNLAVSSPGYIGQSRSGLKPNESGWQFQLLLEPLRLEMTSGEREGKLLLDGLEIWNLREGDLRDFLVPADAKTHTLADVNQNATLFRLEFQAMPAAISQVSPVQTRGLAVVTSFGDNAELYGSGGRVSVAEQEPQQITSVGIPLTLDRAGAEQKLVILPDGGPTQDVYIRRGNGPMLSVLLTGNTNVGTLVVDAAELSAHLFLDRDKRERRASKPGHWLIPGLRPGVHDIRAAAPPFPDFNSKVTIERGKQVRQIIQFAPPTSYLMVRDSPPGAELSVDGHNVTVIDGAGVLHQSMSPTSHSILLSHPGFDSFQVERKFTAGQTIEIQAHDLLRPFGTLQFAIGPSNATVTYNRGGEAKTYPAPTSGSLKLRAGTYRVVGTAPNYESQAQIVVVSSSTTVTARFDLNKHVITR